MIGFAGLSHLGIVSSIAAAAKGFDVLGYDAAQSICDDLSGAVLPIYEPELHDLLSNNKARIQFSANARALAQCDIVYVSLDVSTNDSGQSDLTALNELIDSIEPHLANGCCLVVLCQVPPGYSRALVAKYRQRWASRKITLFYQVETLIFGRAVERALYPERLIVGCAEVEQNLLPVYRAFLESFGCPILPMRFESAELTKISINLYLVASVSVANTLAELCESIGADWYEIMPALKLDRRIGQYAYLSPGLGIAGGNLERDLATISNLAQVANADDGIVRAFIANSQRRQAWALQAIKTTVLAEYAEPNLAIWGLAYKVNTKSIKNSPSLALINNLHGVRLKTYDPEVRDIASAEVEMCASALDACDGAHALVVMTPWAEFAAIGLHALKERMAGSYIIDPYRVLDEKHCCEQGFCYITLGKN